MLLGLRLWLPRVMGKIVVVGDALGVLAAAIKQAARSGPVNEIVKEMALALAPLGAAVEAVHIHSERNKLADALSRGEVPPQLQALPTYSSAMPCWAYLGRSSRAGKARW